jgi:hypothetical protein
MYGDALAELEKSSALSSEGPQEMAIRAHIYGRMGRNREARALLSQVVSRGDTPGYFIAMGYVGLGETDAAFTWLDKTVQERWGPFNELNAEPLFDRLRSDARFPQLLSQIGLPGYSRVARLAGNRIE